MIKTVILDLGGVIVPLDFAASYARLSALSGLTPAAVAERLKETALLTRYETGTMTSAEFHREFSAYFGFDIPFADFEAAWCSLFPPHSLIPTEWLAAIRRQKRLLLLSNTNEIHFKYLLKERPYLADFDAHILSYEARAMKPDPEIYAKVLTLAQCEPQECFFTDDILKYVQGARRAGFEAEQFLGPEKLRRDLDVRGIMVESPRPFPNH